MTKVDTKKQTIIRQGLSYNPDEVTAIPNVLIDRYLKLFKGKEQWKAVMDLIQQSYRAGLEIGRLEAEEKLK